MTKGKRACIYARVSTLNGQTVESQLHDLRRMAGQRGFEIVAEYCDEGVSGGKTSRPQLDLMLKAAKRGEFDILLIWSLSRLGRSSMHLIQLFEQFKAWNVELVSFSEGLDFTTSTGKLLYQMISAFSEFERDCIRERVCAGLRNAKAKGKRLGRIPVAVDVDEIRQLRAEGQSFAKIAAQLGVSVATVHQRATAAA